MDNYNFAILEEKERLLKFRVENVDLSIINSIRRIILSEIPNVAIAFDPYNPSMTDITFSKNTSVLHNEMLGHRLSLIPINLTKEEIENFGEKCINYKYVIKMKNETNDVILVTTDDIVITDNNGILSKKDMERILPRNKITNNGILINKLRPNNHNNALGEEMYVEMKTRVDIAKTHARWSPVSTCTYLNTIDEKKVEEELQKALNGITDEAEIKKIKSNYNSIEKYRLFVKNKYGEPGSMDMTIETECILEPGYLFCKAIDILYSKLSDLISKPNKYTIETIDEDKNIFNIVVYNENHTLANMLQSMIYNLYCRDGKGVNYIGYFTPHPLEERVVFKIMIDTEIFQSVKILLNIAVPNIQKILKNIKMAFLSKVNVE
jgi:DNA-directed RNA polymerase subunit L